MIENNQTSWRILHMHADPDRLPNLAALFHEMNEIKVRLDSTSSFEDGLQKLESQPYQAVLVDAHLGAQTGVDFIRAAAARGCACPLILLDEQGTRATDLEALQAGASFYLAAAELSPLLIERSIRYALAQKAAQAELRARSERRKGAKQDQNQQKARLRSQNEALLMSERDQLIAQLEQERARWKGVVEGIADEVWVCDLNGMMSMMNLAAITAMRLEEFKDHSLEEITEDVEIREIDGQVRPPEQWPLMRSLRGEIVRGEEIMRNRQTGKTRYRQYSAAPTRDAAGNITGSVAIVRDVTEYRRLEENLRQNETQLRAIFEAMSDAIIVIDRSGQVVQANRAAREMIGFDPTTPHLFEKLFSTLSITHLDGVPFRPEEKIFWRAMHGEYVKAERLRVSGPLGRSMELLVSASPLQDEHRRTNGIVVAWHNITELAQVQQSLADQHQRLIDTLESIQDGFMEINWNWQFTYMNRRAAQAGGLQPEQMIGKNLWETYPGLLGTRAETLYRQVMEQRQPASMEFEGILTQTWFEIRVYPSREGITIFWTDINQRKRLEEEQRKLLVAVEQSPSTIMITDTAGRIEYVNPHFTEVTGYSSEEVLGKDPGFLATGYTTPEEYKALWNAIQSGEPWRGVFRNRKRSGEFFWESASIVPVRDDNGQIRHYLAVKEDITERKRAEEAVERSEARLRRLFDTSVIGIMNREPSGKILHMNDSLLHMLGYTRQEVEARPLHMNNLLPKEYLPIERQLIQEVLEKGVSKTQEKEYRRKDGSRVPVLVGLTRLEEPRVEITAFVIDLTDLKETQAVLEEYTEKLKRSNQDLEQFAFVVSHDLQEPLRKITFFSESLSKKMASALDAEARDSLDRMQNAARRMREMIQDLLDLSRVSTRGEAFQEVDLFQVAQDAISDLEGRIHKENGQVLVDPLPTIQADHSQMQRLLQNLIGNALKYHKADEPPVVKIFSRETPAKDRQGKMVTLVVQDNGIGFEQQYAERIFQPFQRLHGRGEYDGTGMGLTICRKIVERHHGLITVESQPDQGSTFIVQLPVRQAE